MLRLLFMIAQIPHLSFKGRMFQKVYCRSHLDPPANGQAVVFLTGLWEAFVVYLWNINFDNSIGQLCSYQAIIIGIGDKLFRYGDFFLKKWLWGPRRANIRNFCYNYPWPTIFWGPYFFGPTWPPYMSKNAKMCHFEHLFGVRWKKPPQNRGPPWKILHWELSPNFFQGLIYMLGVGH